MGKLPTAAILGGVLLNQKLNPATLENESDKQKLMILLRTFFEVHKGWHIQYNIVSRETLLEAKNIRISTAIWLCVSRVIPPSSPRSLQTLRTISSLVLNICCNLFGPAAASPG